jgi:hypothetical protein
LYAGTASALVSLSVFFLAGCSGGEGHEEAARERSEFIALKKANPNPRNFKKALEIQEIELLKAEGVVVKSAAPAKRGRKAR